MPIVKTIANEARDFALKVHAGQLYGEVPYVDHLDYVAYYAELFSGDDLLVAAAYLHDVLEDTGTTYEELLNKFGEDIANLVQAVTSPRAQTRREKVAAALPQIRAAGERAVFLKLCDRIANVTASEEDGPPEKFLMYKSEQKAFEEALYRTNEHEDMWTFLRKSFV